MDNLQVSNVILDEQTAKSTPEKNKYTKLFRVVDTGEGKRFDLNIPSIGSFRMTWWELLLVLLLIKRILKI